MIAIVRDCKRADQHKAVHILRLNRRTGGNFFSKLINVNALLFGTLCRVLDKAITGKYVAIFWHNLKNKDNLYRFSILFRVKN